MKDILSSVAASLMMLPSLSKLVTFIIGSIFFFFFINKIVNDVKKNNYNPVI